MNLPLRIIAAIGQATSPFLHFEIMGAVCLAGATVRHLTARAVQKATARYWQIFLSGDVF
jgi:hypothetical protein